jgi:hypothetical protein
MAGGLLLNGIVVRRSYDGYISQTAFNLSPCDAFGSEIMALGANVKGTALRKNFGWLKVVPFDGYYFNVLLWEIFLI